MLRPGRPAQRAYLYDDFYLWLAGDRALLRIDQHREWLASDPAWASSAGEGEMEFSDENGSSFPMPLAETVSRAQALDALAHWLRTGEMLPDLAWR